MHRKTVLASLGILCLSVFSMLAHGLVDFTLNYPGNDCLSFNGVDDYLDCSGSQIFKQQNLTLEVWVQPKYPVRIGSHPLYYNHTDGFIVSFAVNDPTYVGWWLRFNYADGTLRFGWRFDSSYPFDSREYGTDKAIWSNASWYQIVVTFNPTLPSDNLKFYINGTLDSKYTDSHSIRYGTSRFQIGGFTNSYYGGLIDEVRVWNVSRTQSDIQNTWNRTLDTSRAEMTNPSLVGYWRLDNLTSENFPDYSIYQHDATPVVPPDLFELGAPILPSLIGDVNHDGKVDIVDVGKTAKHFKTDLSSALYVPYCDLNGDGKIDILDISLVAKYFGKTYP